MATVTAVPASKIRGGGFLIEERAPEEVFTPEDFSEQNLLIAQTAEEFANKEIVPNIEYMEHKNFAITRELVKKAGELGLSGVDVPEQYGGMQMDKVTSAIIADRLAKYGGFSTTWGAHTCIGTLPIVYFGTEEQKKKYLPGLASGGVVVRIGCAQLPHSGQAFGRRKTLHSQRRENVDYECRICRSVHRICESGRRQVHRVHHRARFPRFLSGRRGTQDGNSRLLHLPADSQRLPGSRRERAWRDRQRAPHRLQCSERGAVQTRCWMRGLGSQLHRGGYRLCQATQGIRQGDRGFRIDSREAGQYGGGYFHPGNHGALPD